ncbi:MAG: glycosyltransferase family 2 protein [Actinomycetota bacterium]
MRLSYILPLRWQESQGADELATYLRVLSPHLDVIVVDGSPSEIFALHACKWGSLVRHVATNQSLRCANGKVANVLTGLAHAKHDRVVLADDDVRYDLETLRRLDRCLDDADLVMPQNYFDPRPWHAIWDSARSLINRSFWHDFAGTVALRRSALPLGYDGDVLFENLQLERTIAAFGGRVHHLPGVYVRRLPPSARKFWSQRVRQAYDEFARPFVLALWLAIAPFVAVVAWRTSWLAIVVAAFVAMTLAEIGRRRHGGQAVFPLAATVVAPLWIAERSICAWLAVGARVFFGGVRYGTGRIRRAATSTTEIRRRLPDPMVGSSRAQPRSHRLFSG